MLRHDQTKPQSRDGGVSLAVGECSAAMPARLTRDQDLGGHSSGPQLFLPVTTCRALRRVRLFLPIFAFIERERGSVSRRSLHVIRKLPKHSRQDFLQHLQLSNVLPCVPVAVERQPTTDPFSHVQKAPDAGARIV